MRRQETFLNFYFMQTASGFSYKTFLFVVLMTIATGIGAYFLAHQFNDGRITQSVVGSIFLGMALPSLFIGGVMRLP